MIEFMEKHYIRPSFYVSGSRSAKEVTFPLSLTFRCQTKTCSSKH